MLRAADIQLPPFNLRNFSIDIFLRIFTHLLPEQIVWLTAVHRDFNIVKEHEYFADLWGIKSELHFPRTTILAGNTHVMFQLFKDKYINQYNIETDAEKIKLLSTSTDHEKSRFLAHLYSMAIEGETTLFNERKLKNPQDYNQPLKNNKKTIALRVIAGKHQSMRDTIYAAEINKFKINYPFYTEEKIDTKLILKNKTILYYALLYQQPFTHIQMLLEKGSSYEEVYDTEVKPIHVIAMNHSSVEVLQHLLQNSSAQLNAKTSFGNTPLTLACWNGHEEIIQFLLNQKDIDLGISTGTDNILICAAKSANAKCVDLLLKSEKVRENISGVEFLSLVTIFALPDFEKKDDVVKACLDNLPNLINQVDHTGFTLLMHFCKKKDFSKDFSIVEYLIAKVDVTTLTNRSSDDHPTHKNMSVLDIAICGSYLRIIELIINAIKTRFHNATDRRWEMLTKSYSLAKEKKQFQIAALLLQHFPSLAAKDNEKDYGLDKTISRLVSRDNQGEALKHLFNMNTKPSIVQQLLLADCLANERIPLLQKQYIDSLPLTENEKAKLQTTCNQLNDFILSLGVDHKLNLYKRNITLIPLCLRQLVFMSCDTYINIFETFNQFHRKYITGKLLDIFHDLNWFLEWKKDFAAAPKVENNLGMRM